MLRALAALLLVTVLAGCGAPDPVLPGVRTETRVMDSFHCGALVFPQGCPIVRVTRAESGCAPEAGGYVLCNATIDWSATSGAATPGSRLDVAASGEPAGSCAPQPGSPCALRGNVSYVHHFSGPGEKDVWPVAFVATLSSPGGPQASGSFELAVEMTVRTEGIAALTD